MTIAVRLSNGCRALDVLVIINALYWLHATKCSKLKDWEKNRIAFVHLTCAVEYVFFKLIVKEDTCLGIKLYYFVSYFKMPHFGLSIANLVNVI